MIPSLRDITMVGISVAQLSAQGRGDWGTLMGTVASDDRRPLPFARVAVIGTKQTVLTATDGAFVILRVAAGLRVIQIRLAGYSTLLTTVTVAAGDTARVEITLATAAVQLDPVEVTGKASAPTPAMQGFEERRAHAQGHFLNRAEIILVQARRFTDVLRRIPGVQLQPTASPYEGGQAVRMSRTIGVMGARACPVLFYVNGTPFPVTGDVPIDQYIDPDEVAAVEVYSGMSQIPPEFNSSSHNARCGVIVIWTLTGLDTLKSEHP